MFFFSQVSCIPTASSLRKRCQPTASSKARRIQGKGELLSVVRIDPPSPSPAPPLSSFTVPKLLMCCPPPPLPPPRRRSCSQQNNSAARSVRRLSTSTLLPLPPSLWALVITHSRRGRRICARMCVCVWREAGGVWLSSSERLKNFAPACSPQGADDV